MLSVTVRRKWRETDDICCFELTDPAGKPLPQFTAGAHIDVHIRDRLIRQYSLCNSPAETHRYVIAVLRDANSTGGSRALHESVRAGDVLTISAPKNHFPLAPARQSLLLAGGVGVTPLLCMAEQLAAMEAEFELHYCARSPRLAAFQERISNSAFARRVHFHYDDGPAEQRLDLAAALGWAAPGVHVYVCGPAGFIDAVVTAARAQGYTADAIHREYFAAERRCVDADSPFQITLARTGNVYGVPPDKTIIELLRDYGIEVETCCNEGVCGACLTTVLAGEPDHRDSFLSDEERAQGSQMLLCCSRAKSDMLVLDL